MNQNLDKENEDGDEENSYNNPNYIACPDEFENDWRRYCEYIESAYDKDTTKDRRKQTARYWFSWCSNNDVDPFTDDDRKIIQYLNDHQHLSDQSLSARATGVSMLHKWAYQSGKIDHDELVGFSVQDKVDSVNPNTTQKQTNETRDGYDTNYHYATKDDVEAMLDNVPAPKIRNQCIIKILWQTGIRSKELTTIREQDIYLDENKIMIRSAKKDPEDDGYWRPVFFQDDLKFYIKKWLKMERHTLGPYHNESEYLFLTHQSPQMRPSHISRIVKQSAHNADIQEKIGEDSNGNPRWKYTAHCIRHGHAQKICNETEIPLHITARQLGHTVDTLVDTYVHDDDDVHKQHYLDDEDGGSSVL